MTLTIKSNELFEFFFFLSSINIRSIVQVINGTKANLFHHNQKTEYQFIFFINFFSVFVTFLTENSLELQKIDEENFLLQWFD